jgi:hypothetical protein
MTSGASIAEVEAGLESVKMRPLTSLLCHDDVCVRGGAMAVFVVCARCVRGRELKDT